MAGVECCKEARKVGQTYWIRVVTPDRVRLSIACCAHHRDWAVEEAARFLAGSGSVRPSSDQMLLWGGGDE